MIALYVFAGILGAIVGSFLNVVIHRLPRGEPMGMVRSKCPACGTQIAWYDNLPIVSYLLLRGRCRACKGRIALRYPVVEAVTAALFVLLVERVVALRWEPLWLGYAVGATFTAALVALTWIDFQHKLLPDKITIRVLPVIGVVGSAGVPAIHGVGIFGQDLTSAMKPGMASLIVGLAGAALGFGVIYGIRLLGSLLLRREAMGLGDVKFMLAAGLLLGPMGTLLAIGVAMVGGSILGVGIWIATRNREIPFGPFLALGSLAVLLYGDWIRWVVFDLYPAWVRGG